MSTEQIPPRPDGLHPVPAVPPPPTEERPRATWSWWEAIAVYLLAILLGGVATVPVLQAVGDEDLGNLAATALAAMVIVGVLIAWLSTAHRSWRSVVGLPSPGRWWAEVRAGIGFGLLLYPGLVFGVGLVLSLILGAVSSETVRTPEQVPSDLSVVGVAVAAVYAVVIAPIHEELFFRGILYRALRDRYGFGAGLIGSALGFALIHYLDGPWPGTVLLMGVMFFNGIALAWYTERRGNVVSNTVAHMVFNVIGLTLILTMG